MLLSLLASLFALWPVAGTAKVIYVSGSQSTNAPSDGLSWATAFTGIQQGLDAAMAGDEVWVAAASYLENITLKNEVTLLGGFLGGESDPTQRNWTNNVTILDGQKKNSVVVIQDGATNSTHLDGFTIQNGVAIGGGGIHCANASPVIANNTIQLNMATGNPVSGGGGGIYCSNSTALIVNNRLRWNVSTNNTGPGGGFACMNASPVIVSNLFLENTAQVGGAIRWFLSTPLIAHNHILNNRAVLGGGGMEFVNSTGEIRNNVIRGNSAANNGGGITCWFSSPLIINNVIIGNVAANSSATPVGGGIYCTELSQPRIINNTIAWNQAFRGGNIYCVTNSIIIANNIIAFSSSGIEGPTGLAPKSNCVFGNGTNNYVGLADPTGINGNISADPQLNSSSAFPGFHLLPSSPCRDAGDATMTQAEWQDIDDQPRIQGATADIGADESDGTVMEIPSPMLLRVSPNGDDSNDGSKLGETDPQYSNCD
jgi:hypothetical protein